MSSSLLQQVKSIIQFSKKRKRHDEEDLHHTVLNSMSMGALLAYQHESNFRIHGGDKGTEIPQKQRDFHNDIVMQLGPTYFRRSYRMKIESFYQLYNILEEGLQMEFGKSKYNCDKTRNKKGYRIDLKLRLSAAVRYFAGGDPLDIMLSHGISHSSVYNSIWGVVDAVNKCDKLKFAFPDHEK